MNSIPSPETQSNPYPQKIIDRFWAKVDRSNGPDSCWLWTACVNHHGYGVFRLPSKHNELAHRVAYKIINGIIANGLSVCHSCDNPPCCNPSHLFLGTQLDNIIDAKNKGRIQIGESNHASKLNADIVKEIRSLYAAHLMTQRNLADRYKVNQSTISLIVHRKTWQDI